MDSKRTKKLIAKMKRKAKATHPSLSIKTKASKMSEKMTWPEREFEKLLKELGVVYEVQKIVGKKIFDFYVPSLNMLIEVDGDYWHANPLTTKAEDVNRIQARNLKNDKFKNSLAAGLGFSLERVWESELKENYKKVKADFKKILIIK